MENTAPAWVTLDCNLPKVLEARKKFTDLTARSYDERAARRSQVLKETAADDGLQILAQSDMSYIDLAIHRDTFLDDAATQRSVTSGDVLFWKSRYAPTVGVYAASVYGGPPAVLYQTQEYYGTLQPFPVDTEELEVPNMSLTVDATKLGIREEGLARQAESLKIKKEQFLLNTILGAPLGQSIASSISNYLSVGNPYAGRTVYVADPGVRPGTYETTNIVSVPGAGGLTPALFEALISNLQLAKRAARTVHIPLEGQPWRKLFRFANVGVIANAPLTAPGNAGLYSIPPSQYEQIFEKNFSDGFVMNWFGMPLKFKANNALPQGYGVVTTDKPAAEIITVSDLRVSVDYVKDPKNPYISRHYEKEVMAIAAPDPWVRNFQIIYFGNTAGL